MIHITQREMIVRLYAEGKTQQVIAGIIGCSQQMVSRWLKRYKGGKTLINMPRSGRPTKLTKKNLSLLKKKIHSSIKSANADYCAVSTKQVAQLVKQEIGKVYSMRHIERIMHKLGFSLITPRPQHVRHDKKKVEAFRDEFKKNFSRSMWVMN